LAPFPRSAEDEDALLETHQALVKRYGDDITQEAWVYALSQPRDELLSYAAMVAKYLRRTDYNDGRPSRARWHTWSREVPSLPSDEDQTEGLWASHGGKDPEFLAAIRELLRKVPLWVALYCIDEDFVWGGPKCNHPWRYLTLRAVPGNHRLIACQVCRTNREQAWRQKRLARSGHQP
jgi:hypothetical protein